MRKIETMAAGVVAVRGGADLAAWAALLVESAGQQGQGLVLDTVAAVEWVYGLSSPDDEALEGLDSATLARVARDYQPAEAELLERTIGQPFRLEGPNGALFIASALWDFSGGRELGDGESPAWDGLEAVA